jgi:CHAD domain-containing protein
MPYRIKKPHRLPAEFRRIALEQVRRGVQELDDPVMDDAEKVHQVRKRCKKVRGLVRLFRETNAARYQQENDWFRETARPLSALRDAKVLQASYDKIMEAFTDALQRQAFGSIRRGLTDDRKRLREEEMDLPARLAEARRRLVTAAERIEGWSLAGKGFALLQGYQRTYARGREAWQATIQEPSPEGFHEWRKRVKYHWYHTRLLQAAWPAVLRTRQKELAGLADDLGLDHDFAVLAETIAARPEEYAQPREIKLFLAAIAKRREELERRAARGGRRLFAEKETPHRRRMKQYWKAWRAERR